jgi:hypothetical protein
VTDIRKIVDRSGQHVGWVYYTRPGTLFVQAAPQMSHADKEAVKPEVIPSHENSGDSLDTSDGDMQSAIVPVRKLPWKDLSAASCTEHEWSHRKFYNPSA